MTKLLQAFTSDEYLLANDLLSAKVATMLGRKMEEGDWDFVYCNSKNIPITEWSNVNIDINHNGLGVEHKMLRVTKAGSITQECGTTKMHPAGTRSIRIPDEEDPQKAMFSILSQYNELIEARTLAVKKNSCNSVADMRIGWLLWKDTLDEFLYFEEEMSKVDVDHYYAEWNLTPAKGSRKSSRSLWIYERATGKKKFSVTTTAGAKIQPYFDVPAPSNPNLFHFVVQGVKIDGGLVKVWLTKSTAKYLELLLGSLDEQAISDCINSFELIDGNNGIEQSSAEELAVPVYVQISAYEKLKQIFPNNISDEYLFQQLAIFLGESK
ncbi:hypothetical protein NW622_004632 [Vibrio alginolyticus]|nr:hypothetical protein [Vibrio alginolyticus]ELA7821120.1 hypothetical protein [Vibrio alginolyticus]EMC8464525.1 hypothetical protein [Vibrio alginolyticus]EME3938350.1 hypothetical protein [Vibrio alginolyticus]